jgi:hypothetical protein
MRHCTVIRGLGGGTSYSGSLLLESIASVAVHYDHALGKSLANSSVVGKFASCL